MRRLSFTLIFSCALAVVGAWTSTKVLVAHEFSPLELGYRGFAAKPAHDWVFLGQSRIDAGLDMRAFEQRTGASAYGLWYPNMNLEEMEIYLRYIVKHGPPIKNLVIDVPTFLLGGYPEIRTPRLFYDAPPELKRDVLAYYFSQPSIPVSEPLTILFNGFNADLLFYPINRPFLDRACYHGVRKNSKKGLTPTQWKHVKVHPRFLESGGKIHGPYLAALERIVAFLRKDFSGRVIFFDMALSRTAHEHPALKPMRARVHARLRDLGATLVDGNVDLKFDIDDGQNFYDDHHMSGLGRARNTDLFADYVAGLP